MSDYVNISGNIIITEPTEVQELIDKYFVGNLKGMFVLHDYKITAEWYGKYDDNVYFVITDFLDDIEEITLKGNIMLEVGSVLSGFYFDGDCWPEYDAITVTPEDVGGMENFVKLAKIVNRRNNETTNA